MPSINLIAARREEKRRLEQHIRRLIYAILGEVGAIVLVASLMLVKVMTERGQITQLDGQIGLLQGKVNEIQALEQQTAELKPKVAILNEARNNTLYWYTAMQTIVASLPNETWLTNINTGGDPSVGATPPAKTGGPGSSAPPAPVVSAAGGGPTLTFAGQASDSDQVGMAMLKMNQFTNISTVTLNSVNEASSASGAKTMTFSMMVQLKPNTAADAATPLPEFESTPPTTGVQGANAAAPQGASAPIRQAAVLATVAAKETNHA